MPAQHYDRVTITRPRKSPVPQPGTGGYDYPRGPYGATGFPGSTPASKRTHAQDATGRKDPSYRGVPRETTEGQQEEWSQLPARRPDTLTGSYAGGEAPPLQYVDDTAPRPKRPTGVPSLGGFVTGRQVQPPARRKKLTTGPERRETPVIGGAPGSQNVRNQIAQRYKADPSRVRAYRASPNPGKTGAQLDAPAAQHPGTLVHGHPDGKPVPGMLANPGAPPMVAVQSRFVSLEGSQEGYAMNRPLLFARGGTPAPIPPGADPHLRGGRYSGQRYFGALADQQQIGLDSDAYGIARRRGPRHRPVRFEQPAPRSVNYYDLPPDEGTQSPDMIHRSPVAGRRAGRAPVRVGGAVRPTSKPRRGEPVAARSAPAPRATPGGRGRPRRG